MDAVTVIGSMTASAALTLGLVYFMVWLRRRASWAYFWFAVASLSAAALAACELVMLHASSADAYELAQRWGQLALVLVMGSLLWFGHFYLAAGRRSWPWLISGWLGLVLGVTYATPHGTRYAGISALIVAGLVLHGALTAWRRNGPLDRSRALVVGSALVLFLGLMASQLLLVNAGRMADITMLSPLFVILIAAMAYKVSVDLFRSSQLATDLDDSRERLALAADAAHLDFWEYDPGRDRFWISEPLFQLIGFAPGQPVTLAAWLDKVHPDDRPEIAARATRLLKEGGRLEFEYRLNAADGEVHWFSGRGRYVPERGGNAYGINLDVTSQRRQAHELDQLQWQLAHASRVAMLGQLASALAHELNQPLGAILRNAEAGGLLLASATPDQGQLRAIMEDIFRDDRRAGEVIARLRGLLKQQANDHRAVDFMSLVDDVTALLRSDAAMRGVRISKHLDPGPAIVRGDQIHLQQVLLNLVINGMEALDSMAASERSVGISVVRRHDSMLEVCVSDSGPGLPAGLEQRVFDPFFTTKSTGMGVGLSICRTIIEAHGGKIWVDPGAGAGTAFRFTLPLEPGPGAS